MLDLTSVLANNQKLTFLNLSWNFLANSAEHASIPNSWRNELEEMLKNSTEGKLQEVLKKSIENLQKGDDMIFGEINSENFDEKLAIYIA